MKPVAFEGCFGWMHEASSDTGVVLCGAYGHEALWAHRGWRGLAEHLAEQHIPTLRFDYRGTGDALESEENGERVEAWLDSIRAAVDYMRHEANVRRVILCGIRVGGLLASVAATRLADIDGLILLAPVFSGRDHIRELKLTHRRWRNKYAPDIAVDERAPGVIESLGFRLNAETAAHFERLHLLQDAAPTTRRVLILEPAHAVVADKLRDRYLANGAQVDVGVFTDYSHLINKSMDAQAPCEMYDTVSAWIADAFGLKVGASSTVGSGVSSAIPPDGLPATQLAGEGFIETPVIFDSGRLFGIYCQPVSGWVPTNAANAANAVSTAASPGSTHKVRSEDLADAGAYAVLFSNSAGSHHIGEARVWVTHARRLARQGIASLRMDVGLLGDSAQAATSVSVADLHAPQSIKDVSVGIDWLVSAGHKRPTAVGSCSGAFLTLHAAAENHRVAGVMLIKGQVAVTPVAKGAVARRAQQWKDKATYLIRAMGGTPNAKRIVRTKFRALADRGVDVRVLYGAFDGGVNESAAFLHKDFHWLKRQPPISTATPTAVDHGLLLYSARAQMMDAVDRQLHAQRRQDADIQKADRRAGFFGVQRKTVIEKMPEIKNYWVQNETKQLGH